MRGALAALLNAWNTRGVRVQVVIALRACRRRVDMSVPLGFRPVPAPRGPIGALLCPPCLRQAHGGLPASLDRPMGSFPVIHCGRPDRPPPPARQIPDPAAPRVGHAAPAADSGRIAGQTVNLAGEGAPPGAFGARRRGLSCTTPCPCGCGPAAAAFISLISCVAQDSLSPSTLLMFGTRPFAAARSARMASALPVLPSWARPRPQSACRWTAPARSCTPLPAHIAAEPSVQRAGRLGRAQPAVLPNPMASSSHGRILPILTSYSGIGLCCEPAPPCFLPRPPRTRTCAPSRGTGRPDPSNTCTRAAFCSGTGACACPRGRTRIRAARAPAFAPRRGQL